jgi:hypothetical protein
MHFHLPKPMHGWRELLGEVGIIVVGVLIALGAEQLVEQVHWREQTRATRDALYSDAAGNLGAALWRQQQQPCVDRRLKEIAEIFRAHAAGKPIRLLAPIGHPVFNGGPQMGWQIAVSSQALDHMSLEEKLDLAGAFGNYANLTDVLKREQDAWLKLGVLDDPQSLSEGDWPFLHQAYAEASSLSGRMAIITDYVLSTQNLGQRPSANTGNARVNAAVKSFCTPILPAH